MINDDGEFENSFKEIYPPELELNKEHFGDQVCFLDLSITKENRQLCIKLFDKRDDFPFSIVRMPYASSNIPSSIFYSSVGAEILRISRVSSGPSVFVTSSQAVIKRIINQGAKNVQLRKTLKKLYGRNESLRHFSENATNFLNSLGL